MWDCARVYVCVGVCVRVCVRTEREREIHGNIDDEGEMDREGNLRMRERNVYLVMLEIILIKDVKLRD